MRITLTSTGGKVLASTVLLGAAASVAGLGTFGTFTSTTSASATVASGHGEDRRRRRRRRATGSRSPRPAWCPVTPSAARSRSSNTGDQALAGIGLTTAATASSKLDTDATMGLQLADRGVLDALDREPAPRRRPTPTPAAPPRPGPPCWPRVRSSAARPPWATSPR